MSTSRGKSPRRLATNLGVSKSSSNYVAPNGGSNYKARYGFKDAPTTKVVKVDLSRPISAASLKTVQTRENNDSVRAVQISRTTSHAEVSRQEPDQNNKAALEQKIDIHDGLAKVRQFVMGREGYSSQPLKVASCASDNRAKETGAKNLGNIMASGQTTATLLEKLGKSLANRATISTGSIGKVDVDEKKCSSNLPGGSLSSAGRGWHHQDAQSLDSHLILMENNHSERNGAMNNVSKGENESICEYLKSLDREIEHIDTRVKHMMQGVKAHSQTVVQETDLCKSPGKRAASGVKSFSKVRGPIGILGASANFLKRDTVYKPQMSSTRLRPPSTTRKVVQHNQSVNNHSAEKEVAKDTNQHSSVLQAPNTDLLKDIADPKPKSSVSNGAPAASKSKHITLLMSDRSTPKHLRDLRIALKAHSRTGSTSARRDDSTPATVVKARPMTGAGTLVGDRTEPRPADWSRDQATTPPRKVRTDAEAAPGSMDRETGEFRARKPVHLAQALYSREMTRLSSQELRKQKIAEERAAAELAACSFQPNWSARHRYQGELGFLERQALWEENRKKKAEAWQQALSERETDGCTFRPRINEAGNVCPFPPDRLYHEQMSWLGEVCEKRDRLSSGLLERDTRLQLSHRPGSLPRGVLEDVSYDCLVVKKRESQRLLMQSLLSLRKECPE